jgi:RNA polymerase sigma-70 factor (ECF subfamily)
MAEQYKGVIFKVIHAHTSNPAERQDLFQEIALHVWRSVDAFRGEASVVTWIYRVALNTAIDWTRKEERHRRDQEPLDSVEELLTVSGTPDPRLEWLYRRIRTLNEVDRSLALLMLDGLSYRQMATVLGISENYVGVKLNRIKAALAGEARGGKNDATR